MVAGTSGISGPVGSDVRLRPTTDEGGTVPEPNALPWLEAVLDTLLPANDEIPPAGQMSITQEVLKDAQWAPEFSEALAWMEAALPAEFAASPEVARAAILEELGRHQPRLFANIVNLAYNAYYTNPRVLALIERKSGFTATPPQPRGYDIEPFDASILARVKERQPFWRKNCL